MLRIPTVRKEGQEYSQDNQLARTGWLEAVKRGRSWTTIRAAPTAASNHPIASNHA